MLKSDHFVTISLDTNECDICHQSTGEELVTCKQCYQPATDEPVKEGFNRLIGVVHQEQRGHEACFAKSHQVLSQSLGNHRLPPTDSVTSQLKGILDDKLQQIIKYARNEGNLNVRQPLLEVKSTPCSRTASPLRTASNKHFEHSTKRKCTSDENIALRQSRPALTRVPTIYDRQKYEKVHLDNKKVEEKVVEHERKAKTQQDYKVKQPYLHESKSLKRDCDVECQKETGRRETIKIPSDRFVYLPCEHQYASQGWSVDELICDLCEQHHNHQMNQSDYIITSSSQSESSTDNELDDLLPVTKSVVKSSNKDIKDFKVYSIKELEMSSKEQLSEILNKLQSRCTDVSAKLVGFLQDRDNLKQEVNVQHLMIEKLVSIQSSE